MRVRAVFIAGLAALASAAPAQADTFTVTNGSSDSTADCTGTTCPSLRAAIAAAEITRPADVINVPAGTIQINNDLVVASDITIVGSSARSNIIDGGAKYRGLRVTGTTVAALSHFTIRNGAAGQGASTDGGGILVTQGATLSLDNVRVTGSRATRGGGIANLRGSLGVQHSLIDGNTSTGDGGGIFNLGGVESPELSIVQMVDSTVFDNTAGDSGAGGVASRQLGSIVTVGRSTIADNTGGKAGVGGLAVFNTARVTVTGSILARNIGDSVASNCSATKPTDGGFNVEASTQCAFGGGGSGLNPQLATSLTSAGGEVDVLAITGSSPAFNRLPVSSANCPAGTLDQRGMYRPQGSACDSGAVEVDQAATMTITSGPSGTVTSGDVNFTFSSSEPGVNPVCQLTGPGQPGGYVGCDKVNAQPYSGLANGTYTFSVRDGAFPSSTPATQTFTVAALDTTITGGPTGLTNDSTPTFTFTGVSAASFQCRFDAATFATCASPFTPTAALTQGAHTFEVRALSASGAPDATPATRSFTVDSVAPDTLITAGPTGTVSSTSATFTFSSTETPSTFQCALDSATFGACPASYTGLSQGSHTFQVRATDSAGNTDATPASRTWTVDTVAPDTTITAPTPSPSNDTTPTWSFSSEAGATFQCRVDAAAFAGCSSPLTTAALTDGTHTFEVRATDVAGNVDPTPAAQTFVVDTTAPNTTLTPISSPTSDTTPTFTFSSEAGASFQCRVDGVAFASCASPFTTAALSQGAHTVDVRAIDAAGNADLTPATQTFTVDTAAPDTTLTPIASPSNDNTPTFNFSSEAGATFQCRVDAAAFTACTSPLTTAALADGSHTFTVAATDAAGNTDPSPAAQTFVIDTSTPDTTITAGPGAATNDTTPTFTFSGANGASGFQCRVDGAAYSACSSPFTTAVLGAGSHTVDIRALNAAGTPDPSPASRTFVVDVTAPETTILTGPGNPGNDTTPTFTFSSNEPGSTFECRVDGAAFTSCVSGFTTATLTAATHTFDVRATDAAGNPDPTPATRTFVIDTTAPETTITAGPNTPGNDTTPTFSFSSEAGATFECRVDTAAYASCTSASTTTALAEGTHSFEVRAIDAAGNPDPTPATRTFVIDLTAPNTTLTAPAPSPSNDTTPTFGFSSTETGSTFECRIDTGAYAACTSPFTSPATLVDGQHTFDVRATDPAGNLDTTPATQTFVIDTAAPAAPVVQAPTAGARLTSSSVVVSGTAEAGSSIAVREGSDLRGTTTATSGSWTVTVLDVADGAHTYSVRATDVAGNSSAASDRNFIVDTGLPNTTITVFAATPSNNRTPSWSFTSSEPGSTFQCRIDGGAFASCTSPFTAPTQLAPGSHSFDVFAIDPAGNPDPTPSSQTIIVDITEPNTTLTPIASPTNDTTPTFTFTSEAGATFECRVDGAAYATCTSAFTTAVLTPGQHTFDVRAKDTAGNIESTPGTQTFVIDTTEPNTTLAPIASPTSDTTPTFTFTSEAGATFQCRVDSAAFAACSSPRTTAVLSEGTHTFEVRAIDTAGNTESTPGTQTFVIDTGPPETTIADGPPEPTNDGTPTFTFGSDETGSTFECRVDAGAFAACTSPFTTAGLSDGGHAFAVRATDSSGNVDGSPAIREFTVDTTPPAVPAVVSGPAGPTTNAAPEFAFSATDSVSCKLDGPGAAPGSYGPCVSPKTFSALAPGDYVFFVRSVDAAGNEQTTQRAFTVTVMQQAAPTPTPTPTPSATPTPTPPPVEGQSVGMKPVGGKVLIKLPGSSKFVPLDPSVIKNGAEVDTRNGVVEITRSDGGVAKFYDGIFKLSQSGGITTLTLTEKLTGCPKGKKKASAAAKKPKTRKLWGDGKGKFRTRGQFSAATVRGTKWLVQDTCTNTLTRVAQGVVTVEDFAKRKKVVVRQGKRYTASAKR